MKLNPEQGKVIRKVLLLFVFVIGLFFRFYNLNWDQGNFFHPDERNISKAVSEINFFGQLNPHFFAYGGFPIYLYRIAGEVVKTITANSSWVSSWGKINLIGRTFSATFSSLAILLVFMVAKWVFNNKVGVLAACFTAFVPLLIQTGHFGITESMLCFWGLIIALFSLKILQKPTLANYLAAGAVLGLAAGTKFSALSFLIFPVVAHLFASEENLWKQAKYLFSFFGVLVFFFFLSSPYTFLDFSSFRKSIGYEGSVVSGQRKVCYVYQFYNTYPYIYQIKNLFWTMGPFLAFSSLLGFFVLSLQSAVSIFSCKTIKRKRLLLISWPVAYFLIIGSWFAKFVRYTVPLLPFFCIFAAWVSWWVVKRFKFWGRTLICIIVATTFLYASAFVSIYSQENTRIIASRWMYENIFPQAKILTEHWDDSLPVNLKGRNARVYRVEDLEMYAQDSVDKLSYLAEKLSTADYLVLSSRRLYGTLMQLPEKYPLTSRYYYLLFSGELGYEKVAEFASYPQIFGVTIKTSTVEETFQVYDHPKVIIFRNVEQFSDNQLRRLLSD